MNENNENGNVLVYVLIAIVLFAALGFTLSRQTQNASTKEIDDAKAELYAMDLITYATQARLVLDQMIFTGSSIDDFIFTLPSEAGFSTAPHIHKVYHPQGGGLTPANLPPQAVNQVSSSPAAGWYLGLFNNVEWTKTAATDVILTAYQISKPVCEAINKKITGSKTIPALTGNMEDYLIDTTTNNNLTSAICAACDGYVTLCVSNSGVNTYSFYSIVAER